MDRGAWWATVWGGCKESDMIERLSIPTQTQGMRKTEGEGIWMVPERLA